MFSKKIFLFQYIAMTEQRYEMFKSQLKYLLGSMTLNPSHNIYRLEFLENER